MRNNARKSDHFDGERFFNPGAEQARGLLDVLRWKLAGSGQRPAGTPEHWPPGEPPPEQVNGNRVRLTFVNHATVLIQFGGQNLITDPVWSERASPLSWIGPRRHRPPGFRFQDLPRIHVVLISHNHYDHLDAPVVSKLISRDNPEFVVPLRLAPWFRHRGSERVTELDWWDECSIRNIR